MADEKFRMPDTGQTRCYDNKGNEIPCPKPHEDFYGQNGCFPNNVMSFSKLDKSGMPLPESAGWGDGLRTIIDNNTGLVWEVKSPNPDDVNYQDDKYSWEDAQKTYVAKLNDARYGGFDDWRMPNKDELRSIIDYSMSNPAVDRKYFPNCRVDIYWCSVTYEMQPYFGWVIFFGLGSATVCGKTNARHVRAVRGGNNMLFGKPDLSRFTDNGDGTITDNVTGLMWQKSENERMDWFEGLKHCANLKLAGYNDWRMPNIKELNTILDLSYSDGWWYFKKFFPADGLKPPLLHYFSSTVFENIYAWVTNFCFGYDGYYANKKAKLLVRAVRFVTPPKKTIEVFKLPDTGQVLCYDDEGNRILAPKNGEKFHGQDGSFAFNPMSFTKQRENGIALPDDAEWEHGLRMVKDNNTGLIWEVKSPIRNDINHRCYRYNWCDAHEFIETLNKRNYGGFSDWRMPNRDELRSIVDYNDVSPSIDMKYFPNTLPDFYWSSNKNMGNPDLIWGIYFGYGCSIFYFNKLPYLVRAVRGGYNRNFGDIENYSFADNGDGTITDNNTGLMWKKDECPDMNLVDALKYCRELKLARHDDWRLPNQKELSTILDLSFKDGTWFHKEYFPDVKTAPLGFYWASTTFIGTFGWGINFQFGYDGYYAGKKNGCYPFRPVRTI